MSYCTLSIDWEDFGQLLGIYHFNKETPPAGGAIERQTQIMLDLLDETGNKATFFILGMLAKYRKGLVKQIASRGHEIAIHGQNHIAMYTMSPKEAKKDLEECMSIVSDITGEKIYGYRAPYFSINETNLWLLEILAELGFEYDSSIFPKKMPRYGIDWFSSENALYDLPNGKQLVELPLTVVPYLGKRWPVSGGGYLRALPQPVINKVFRDLNKRNVDGMIYMHPYEFDDHPLDVRSNYPEGATYSRLKVLALNLRWNLFRDSIRPKMRSLLNEHRFLTCLEKAKHVKTNGNSSELLGRKK
ncbi:MAG: polysaccharide deacetylase family protein [Ferruginibacter sp.]|nr:polysaccharide deacetylase family protein [Ferruginibacter sp.]